LLAAPVALWTYLGLLPANEAWRDATKRQLGDSPLLKVGTYGDSFGAVNSLASSLALSGVAIALLLQWREQHDARREAIQERELRTDLETVAALIHGYSSIMNLTHSINIEGLSRLEKLHQTVSRDDPVWPSVQMLQMGLMKTAEGVHDYQERLNALTKYAEDRWGWKLKYPAADRQASKGQESGE
jgi:hypothetical protein